MHREGEKRRKLRRKRSHSQAGQSGTWLILGLRRRKHIKFEASLSYIVRAMV